MRASYASKTRWKRTGSSEVNAVELNSFRPPCVAIGFYAPVYNVRLTIFNDSMLWKGRAPECC